MLTAFLLLIVCLSVFYGVALGVLWVGLGRLIQGQKEDRGNPGTPPVSVVVSARNEAKNLPRLLACLAGQTYPADKLEIVVVDDRSEDESWKILTQEAAKNPRLRPLRVTDVLPDFAPKKRALDLAIRSANGEVILLTDADCTPPATWVRAMLDCYMPDVSVVLGHSPYRFDTPLPDLIKGMLALDYFSLSALAAAGIGWGRPVTATGTNMSYRKFLFLQTNGFEGIKHWVSGDDDLFVHQIDGEGLNNFMYALHPSAYVPAAAPVRWKQFWHQRIRYASKGLHYNGRMVIGLIAVYLLNVSITVGILGFLFWGGAVRVAILGAWLAKSVAEYVFLRRAAAIFHERALLKFFIPTALLHPFYVTLFGFLGSVGHYRWKGTKFNKTMHNRSKVGERREQGKQERDE